MMLVKVKQFQEHPLSLLPCKFSYLDYAEDSPPRD